MDAKNLFSVNRKSSRINESLSKKFGTRLNLESFNLQQLEDSRNRLRTQISQIRQNSNFNENLENDAFIKAQFMLDAINAEIEERDEHIVETDVEEGQSDVDYELHQIARSDDEEELVDAMEGLKGTELQIALEDMMSELKDELASKGMNDVMRDEDKMIEMLMDKIIDEYGEDGEEYDYGPMDSSDADADALKSAGFGSDEDYESIQTEGQYKDVDDKTGKKVVQWLEYHSNGVFDDDPHLGDALIRLSDKWETGDMSFRELKDAVLGMFEQGEWQRADFIQKFAPNKVKITQPDMFDDVANEVSPPGFKGTVKAMKKHDEIDNPYALAWHMKKKGYKSHKKADGSDKNESVTRGENMTRRLREGEVQQASAIVTAKTMVDRVGRWIEELSGMENETLLQLGDSIRDEMGQEQARAFIESVAPAIQQALETLKGTRETLSSGVNTLATGEQPADMLGAEPEGGDMGGEEAPMDMEMPAGDEFAAAEPAAGGAEEAGRQQRESIDRQSRLLKMLAG
jgi:hypothetical protein